MKKFFFFCLAVILGLAYVKSHYTPADAFAWAQAKKDPKWTPKAEFYMGRYYQLEDQNEEAGQAFETLLKEYPATSYKGDALFHLGETYEATRNKARAMELYLQYLEEFPNGTFAELARKKIDIIKSS